MQVDFFLQECDSWEPALMWHLSGGCCRWEDKLSENLKYDDEGNVKTMIRKAPFVQVDYHHLSCAP